MKKNNWIHEDQYKTGNKQVLNFIEEFMSYYDDYNKQEDIRMLFRAGYCYQFAAMLKHTFNRGEIVWCAPFGHICWQDTDGNVYDIEGIYEGEAFYFIPESYLGEHIKTFKHADRPDKRTNTSDLISITHVFCDVTKQKYDPKIEDYLGFNITLQEVISYTTRAMREGETNGVEHIFITPEESKKIQENDTVLAYTKIGEFEYFVTDKVLTNKNLYIIDPNGIEYLRSKNINRDLKVIYISVPNNIREDRAKSRSDYKTAYKKRAAAEDKQFSKFEKSEGWDKHIINIDFETAKTEMIEYIETSYTDKVLYLIAARTCSGKDSLMKAVKTYFNTNVD